MVEDANIERKYVKTPKTNEQLWRMVVTYTFVGKLTSGPGKTAADLIRTSSLRLASKCFSQLLKN